MKLFERFSVAISQLLRHILSLVTFEKNRTSNYQTLHASCSLWAKKREGEHTMHPLRVCVRFAIAHGTEIRIRYLSSTHPVHTLLGRLKSSHTRIRKKPRRCRPAGTDCPIFFTAYECVALLYSTSGEVKEAAVEVVVASSFFLLLFVRNPERDSP